MSEETTTQDQEVQNDQTQEQMEATEQPTEPTAGDIINRQEQRTVGLDKFLEMKRENRDLRRAVEQFESSVRGGATRAEISDDISSLAQEYDIDQTFLSRLAATMKNQAEKELEAKISDKLKPIEEREMEVQIDKDFNKYFKASLAQMPDLKGIINKEAIKTIWQDPANSHKTLSSIIEEVYGGAVPGKRTLETTTPGGGKEPESLDYQRAVKDMTYFNQVMANPRLKAQYNEQMLKSGF